MNVHTTAINGTRIVIAIILALAIWTAPGLLANILATVGTVLWLFLPHVVRLEEKLYEQLRRRF